MIKNSVDISLPREPHVAYNRSWKSIAVQGTCVQTYDPGHRRLFACAVQIQIKGFFYHMAKTL